MDKRSFQEGPVREARSTMTRSSLQDRDWLFGLGLFLAALLIYSPVCWAGFVWDDSMNLTANPRLIGLLGLKNIWTTSGADICPLTLTTFWMEHAVWGLAPLPYHLVNVAMHGACAVLLGLLLRSLNVPGAWLGAALWAFHPVQVESVAWITEMKNTESGVFYLLTILFFVRCLRADGSQDRSREAFFYRLSLLCAFLAIASKSSTVILPGVLCLCAWWVEGRWRWRNLGKVAPVVLMSIAATLISIWTQKPPSTMANDPVWVRSWPERLITAGDTVWFYLGELVWPHPLMAVYPRWQINASSGTSYLPLVAVMVTLSILWLNRESWVRPFFFTFAYFAAGLIPVLGLVNMPFSNQSFVADHYQYLASMGPLALVGAGMVRLAGVGEFQRQFRWEIIFAGLLTMLGLLSWQRAWVFQNEETLWTDSLAKNPTSWAGHHNLGLAFFGKGRMDEAIGEFQKSVEINPKYDEAHYNLGIALVQEGRVDEAIMQYEKALEINPGYVDARINLGTLLSQKGHADEGLAQFEKALEVNPKSAKAYFNIGVTLSGQGKIDEALTQYEKALEIDPYYTDAHTNLGIVLFKKGHVEEAMAQFQEVLRLNPEDRNARSNLAKLQVVSRRVR